MTNHYTQNASLHLAAAEGNVFRVKELVSQRGNLVALDAQGRTALHYALMLPVIAREGLKKEKEEVADVLIKASPDLLLCADEAGDTPAHLMASGGFTALLEKVVGQNRGLGHVCNHDGIYPVHAAIANQQHQVTQILLKQDATLLTLVDSQDRTLFHHCAMMNNATVLDLLFHEKGKQLPSVNSLNESGQTSVDVAIECGYRDISELLRKHGGKESHHSTRPLR